MPSRAEGQRRRRPRTPAQQARLARRSANGEAAPQREARSRQGPAGTRLRAEYIARIRLRREVPECRVLSGLQRPTRRFTGGHPVRDKALAALMIIAIAWAVAGCARHVLPAGLENFQGRLDPGLWLVKASVDHRVVVFRRCHREQCLTQTYLQWLGSGSSKEVSTVPVEEANGAAAFVKDARWTDEHGRSVLYLDVLNASTREPQVVLRVEPLDEGRYLVTCEAR